MNIEEERLKAVNRFIHMDDNIAVDLNEIVNLAADICNTPVALTTLLDKDIQWFKASKGVDIDCTNRDVALCNYTIEQDGILVINDTLKDERFANNPLVANAPHVRFYAGVTLTTKDGFAVGTLCVIDLEPRELSQHQQNSLKVLAKQVVNLMELNWSVQVMAKQHEETKVQRLVLEKSELKLNAIFNSSKDIHILVGRNLEVLAFNKAASVHVRSIHSKRLDYGDNLIALLDPDITKGLIKYFEVALSGKSIKKEWMMWPNTKHACWKETTLTPVKDINGDIIGVALNSADVTERKQQEKKIQTQNDALTRIAIIQSHELRRPVASLMGLLDLIKMERPNGEKIDYLDLLELTVQELDEKIRDIVKDSEQTIYTPQLKVVA